MSFLWPSMLLLLLLIPLFVGFYFLLQQRRKRLIVSYGNLGFVQAESGRGPGARRHIPPALFLLSLTALTFALARPQTVMNLPRVEGTVILVFDVSGSMAADDIKPTRMEAAKAAASEFVERQPPGVQVGIVAFSEGGLSVLTPTNDKETLTASIQRLSPQRGTSLANGILVALDTIAKDNGQETDSDAPAPGVTPTPVPEGKYSSAVIVLLTDGENNMLPDPFAAAQTARDRGVRVHTIGVGSAAGVILEVNDYRVHTQLDEAALKQISQITDGTYFNAQSEEDLREIYENIEPQFVIKAEEMEVTSVFAGIGILILLIGGAFSLLWFSRVP